MKAFLENSNDVEHFKLLHPRPFTTCERSEVEFDTKKNLLKTKTYFKINIETFKIKFIHCLLKIQNSPLVVSENQTFGSYFLG